MSKQNFLLIEHGGARKQFTLKALKQKGLNVYLACTTFPDWAASILPKDNVLITDTYNSVKLLSDVVAFFESKKVNINAIGTFYEHTVAQTADLARALNLIGLDPGAARRSSHNKLLMRITCRKAGIQTPNFKVVKGLDIKNLQSAIREVGYPSVIKPIFGAESYGTVKIENDSEIKKAIGEIKLNTTTDKKEVFKNFTETFLVEEYLSGTVVSVDGVVQDKKIMVAGMVEFVMGPEPRFTQEANFIPTRLDKKICSSCKTMAKRVIKALGFDNCGFHCELRVTQKGPILIEIAARLPGGPLQPGYEKAHGIDLTSVLIDIWLGRKIKLKPSTQRFVIQKAVFPRQKGQIVGVTGINEVKRMKGLWDFAEISHRGEDVVTYPDIPKPFYFYAAAASNPKSLEFLSQKIEMMITYEVKDKE